MAERVFGDVVSDVTGGASGTASGQVVAETECADVVSNFISLGGGEGSGGGGSGEVNCAAIGREGRGCGVLVSDVVCSGGAGGSGEVACVVPGGECSEGAVARAVEVQVAVERVWGCQEEW